MTGGSVGRSRLQESIIHTIRPSGDLMKSQKWGLILCLLITSICLLMGADQVAFKSVKARDAKVAYEEAMKKADVDYSEKVLTSKKNYRARLETAKAAVMQSGDLDEAN